MVPARGSRCRRKRCWLSLLVGLALAACPGAERPVEDVAVLERQLHQLLATGLASASEEQLRLLRAAVTGDAPSLLPGGAGVGGAALVEATPVNEADVWDLRVHVADWGSFAARLVVRSWRMCQWTRAFPITDHTLTSMGLDLETVKTVRRCDGSTGMSYHNCYFYDRAAFSRLGLQISGYGFLVEDGNWAEEVKEGDEVCQGFAREASASVAHPSRVEFPVGLGSWLLDRLIEKGLAAPGEELPERLMATAVEAMSRLSICREDVQDFIRSWTPPPDSQMIMIGCGTMCCNNPMQPLLDIGLGGLFVDMRHNEIAQARQKFGAPGRVILNATVSPSVLPGMFEKHARFVQRVEAVQIDIDNMDGPVLMKMLDFVSPSLIVVEVRHAFPFPVAYACVECSMDEVALRGLGGATLGYWLRELERHGYELEAMDRLDALFVRRDSPKPWVQRRERFLGTMACYLRNSLAVQRPADLFNPPTAHEMRLHRPVEVSGNVLDEIKENLTQLHSDFEFVLGF